jgi:hypothetical protein
MLRTMDSKSEQYSSLLPYDHLILNNETAKALANQPATTVTTQKMETQHFLFQHSQRHQSLNSTHNKNS